MTDGENTSDVVLAVMLLLPLIAYLFDGSFELAVLVYLAVIAHAAIKIHEEVPADE